MGRRKKEREDERVIELYCAGAREGAAYVMMPTGLYCNEGLRRAKRGDRVRLHDGWRTEERSLGGVLTVKTDSETFDFFFGSIFAGRNVTKEEMMAKWDAQMIMEGKGRNVVSRDEVAIAYFNA